MTMKDRIIAILIRQGPAMSANELRDILKPWWGLCPVWTALWSLERQGILASQWRPLEDGRKYRAREYRLATPCEREQP